MTTVASRPIQWASHADLVIRKTPTVGREEYLDHMTFRRRAAPMFTEIFGPLIGLKEEWEAQGATAAELDFSAFRYRCESRAFVPARTGRIGDPPGEILEDTDEHRIWRDGLGRTVKLCKGAATLPLPLDFPVRTMDDWRRLKPRYTFSAERLAGDWAAAARRARAADQVVCVAIPGGFDEPRELMGEEALCLAYYDAPELIHDILDTLTDTALRVLDPVSATVPVDALVVHEDLAGKSGSLVGPAQIREFIAPYYRRVWNLLRDRGARLFDVDTDGNINSILDALLDAGVNCLHPMEPAAGMDIVAVRAKYGTRLAFYGGLDKHVLRRSKDEIRAELERKIPPMVATGGCVLALDHRIPNGTPLENYRYYVETAWRILDREVRGADA